MGLWALAGSHSMCYLTDGFIEGWFVDSFPNGRAIAERLVESGLWLDAEGGYQFHDWGEYQPTRESVQAEREAAAERKRRWKEKRDAERKAERDRNGQKNAGGTRSAQRSEQDQERVENTAPTPTPTPSPQSLVTTPLTPQGGKKRGTRLDPSWMPPQPLIDQMRNECPAVDLASEHKVFIDYWIAQPGQKGIKLDWEATWRNWMRRKQGDSSKRMTPTQRAQQTAAAGRQVAGMNITTFALEG